MVLPYRPTRRVTELIATQFGLAGREVVLSIQLIVAEKLEHVAVNAVGARFGNRVNDGAAEFPVLGIKAVSD